MIRKTILTFMCVLTLCFAGCKANNNDILQDTTTTTEEPVVKDKQDETSKVDIFMDSTTYAEKFVFGQDFNYMYQMDNNGLIVARTEDGYYFHRGSLYYADFSLETVVPVCTKTTCKHIGAGAECDGYLGRAPLMPNLQYYNGKLYFGSQLNLETSESFYDKSTGGFYSKIYECSMDMKEKKELDIIFDNITPVIHRGFAYYFYMENVEKEVNGEMRTVRYGVVSRVNMETGEEDRILDSSAKLITAVSWLQNIVAYRNYVYFRTVEGTYLFSIKDGSFRRIENLDSLTQYKYWFMDDKLLIQYTDKEDAEKCKVYTANLDFTDVKYAFDKKHASDEVGYDGMYIYADNRFDSVRKGIDRVMYYYDRNTYELLGEVNLGMGTSIERYGYGDEKYYFYLDNATGKTRLMYFEKAALAAGNAECKVLIE